jgi:hypothetical protein
MYLLVDICISFPGHTKDTYLAAGLHFTHFVMFRHRMYLSRRLVFTFMRGVCMEALCVSPIGKKAAIQSRHNKR